MPVNTQSHDGKPNLFTQDMFRPSYLFTPSKHSTLIEQPISCIRFNAHETEITGSSDPFTLRVSYRQPLPDHEDIVVLCLSCCNTTSVALNDFEIAIRPKGPVRCVDPSNDLRLRMMQGGSTTSSLLPFGIFKAEKRFLIQRMAPVVFYFQVVFQEMETIEGGEGQIIPIRLALTNPFKVTFDALFRCPKPQLQTAALFQNVWQRYVENGLNVDY